MRGYPFYELRFEITEIYLFPYQALQRWNARALATNDNHPRDSQHVKQ
jgi:hypothetical protein